MQQPPPDPLEKSLRFGCGFLLGGFVLMLIGVGSFFGGASVCIFIGALVCGLLAVHYGDRLFQALFNGFPWW